jgi:hypothetical protein
VNDTSEPQRKRSPYRLTLTLTFKEEISKGKDSSPSNEPDNTVPATSNLNGNNDNSTQADPFAGALRFPSEELGEDAYPGSEEENEPDPNDVWEVISGPLPKAARIEAQKLGDLVVRESERIARKFKKSRREVVFAAGLGIRPARKSNPCNMFRKWYAHQNPRKKEESEWFF